MAMGAGECFDGLEFVVEPVTGTENENKAAETKKNITDNGGVLSRIVTEETSFVIVCDVLNIDHGSPRLVKAQQHSIPILSSDYISCCANLGQLIPHDDFTVIIKTVIVEEQAVIPTSVDLTERKPPEADPIRLQVWSWGDVNNPFPASEELRGSYSYELVKSVLLQNITQEMVDYCVIEIHTNLKCEGQSQEIQSAYPHYRVFIHYGKLQDAKNIHCGTKECRYTDTGQETEQLYSYLFETYINQGYQKTTALLSRWIGSLVYRKRMLQSWSKNMKLSDEVAYLVDFVWREAMGTLSAILRVPVRSVSLEKVEKAEAILLDIRKAIDNESEEAVIRSKSDIFFEIIPHKQEYEEPILTKKVIARKQDICQLIKDIVNANESTGWSQLSDEVSKFRALNCMIESLPPDHVERKQVEKMVISTQEEEAPVTINNVFAVSRSIEEAGYDHSIGNDQLMMHCSRPANFLGILSRGLLLPKIVVSELGIVRRDAGLLGSGLYFGDKISTASLYSAPSELTGTRLMVVAQVALGKIKDIFEYDMTLEVAPDGFNSTHGIAKQEGVDSQFTVR